MEMHPKTREAYELMHDGTLALAKAERQGIRFSEEYALKTKEQLTKKIEILEKKLKNTKFYKDWQKSTRSSVNFNSDAQLREFLYNTKGITPTKETKKGLGSTDEETLASLNIPALNILLKIRKLKKIRDTYLESFLRESVDGYIHPNFNLNFVKTFRSSSSDPNFQNIPNRDKQARVITRKCLFPRPGNQWMELDFSSLEVRIAAAYHKDPTMLKYLREDHDMHGDLAIQIYKVGDFDKSKPGHNTLRKAAKNGFVFAQFYGDWYKKCAHGLACTWGKLPEGKWKKGQGIEVEPGLPLADHLISNGFTSLTKFEKHIERIENHFWNKRFPVYRDWKENIWDHYQKNGYVDLYTGFRCNHVTDKNKVINAPIQGAAFHCLLWSLIRIDFLLRQKGYQTRVIGQIHDAIDLDVYPPERDDVIRLARHVMCVELPQNWKWINVPLEIEADVAEPDQSFAELKPYQIPK